MPAQAYFLVAAGNYDIKVPSIQPTLIASLKLVNKYKCCTPYYSIQDEAFKMCYDFDTVVSGQFSSDQYGLCVTV